MFLSLYSRDSIAVKAARVTPAEAAELSVAGPPIEAEHRVQKSSVMKHCWYLRFC